MPRARSNRAMDEPNPYESSKADQPLKVGQIVKRGLGMTTVVLLTPVAVFIAACISCGTIAVYIEASARKGPALPMSWLTGLFYILPVATLIVMIVWIVRAQLRESEEARRQRIENPGHEDRG